MAKDPEVIELAGGGIRLWMEQARTILLKAVTPDGQPVALTVHDINDLIRELRILKSRLD
jgi:hypothetical protein